ncbi:MAG TPA: hypothetical protein VNR20_04665 [Terriglobales bacterium]|nr:hypothetical protein [Terriglobales bacterium]
MKFVAVLLSAGLLLAPSYAFGGHTLTQREQSALSAWVSANPTFRAAIAEDCDCKEDIAQLRRESDGKWKAIPDYQPYVATGDFNGDSHRDFAVVVIHTSEHAERRFSLLVFNGPFGRSEPTPAFKRSGLDLRHQGLFFGAPRPRPYRLVVGPFESEGALLIPRGKSYVWKP